MKKAITIFGSTGNLMYKKLIPALDSLLKKGHLDNNTQIYCMARKDCTLTDYIEDAKTHVKEEVDWDRLVPYMKYINIDINQVEGYKKLQEQMNEDNITESMFYLAVPPVLFPAIAQGISDSGLIKKGQTNKRIVFEKPFGENLESAKNINKHLWNYFDESQIYRIDHYLGKEMIQNILVVRFANKIFEQAWNNETIESVHIIAKEKESILSRGGYYDKIGALKDMLQSHLLQMASLIAMEKPKTYNSEDIKDAKVKVLKDFKILPKDVITGQYDGYLNEDKVHPNSNTETFVFAQASISNERWRGVHFYFTTGKNLDEKRSEIIINFKSTEGSEDLWPNQNKSKNQLVIKVAPEEGVMFQFNVKEPGLGEHIVPAKLDYCHSCQSLENTPEAYEKLLLDLLNNHRTLFTRWDEIESTWTIIDKLSKSLKKPMIYKNYNEIKELINSLYGEEIDDL